MDAPALGAHYRRMVEPIVFISISRILERDQGKLAQGLAAASRQIETSRPRTALFGAYLDEGGHQLRIVHVFPDAAALAVHFEGSEQRTQAAARLLAPVSFEIYGDAPQAAIRQLRAEAAGAGGRLDAWPQAMSGFLRAPA